MTEELKPCPFCGSPADPEGWSSIDRKGPACTNGECDGAADSAEAWNKRVTDCDSFDAGWEKALLLQPVTDDMVERACERICRLVPLDGSSAWIEPHGYDFHTEYSEREKDRIRAIARAALTKL